MGLFVCDLFFAYVIAGYSSKGDRHPKCSSSPNESCNKNNCCFLNESMMTGQPTCVYFSTPISSELPSIPRCISWELSDFQVSSCFPFLMTYTFGCRENSDGLTKEKLPIWFFYCTLKLCLTVTTCSVSKFALLAILLSPSSATSIVSC